MEEKDMVLDALNTTKASLNAYGTAIIECDNTKLRDTFIKMRDGGEKFQYDLYKLANDLGYYKTPTPADKKEITESKNALSKSSKKLENIPAPTMH